jgi:uncharacterized protein YndB with AHSA1/START domain
MNEAQFVYVIYIAATPETVWRGLLDSEMTKRYWDRENVSDWKPGSTWEHRKLDAAHTAQLAGKVIEFSPPKRLVMTWANADQLLNIAEHSQVAIDLEPTDNMVRLTVTHSKLKPGSDMERGISAGWPRVLCSLKSLLETGTPLNTWAGKKG